MKKYFLLTLCLMALLASGCARTYQAPMESVQNVNVYSSYDGKIKGSFDIIINIDPQLAAKDVKPSSYICSAHTFPIDTSIPLKTSIYAVTEKIFEQINERTDIPSPEIMLKEQKAGYIIVRLKEFEPVLTFVPGFFSGTANSSCETALEVEIRDRKNVKVFETAVSGNRSASGDAGSMCGDGSKIMAEAVKKSFRETLERYAERLSNTEKLHAHFAAK
ncbi:MAG: hypothetical protein IKY97_00455 [Mailhella sp.]|nr:hypothetical protein [Mailhella sp.]